MGYMMYHPATVIPVIYDTDLNILAMIWMMIFFLPMIILGYWARSGGIAIGMALMSIVIGISTVNGDGLMIMGLMATIVYTFSVESD
jgi:hypothetical protein